MKYQAGFGNFFSSEALPGALPKGQNNPQKCPLGLYAEQLSGSAFTEQRKDNQRSWLYRGRPTATKQGQLVKTDRFPGWDASDVEVDPNQMRWDPIAYPTKDEQVDFIQGVQVVACSGDPCMKSGLAIYTYSANTSMDNSCFTNADGDFLIVPQAGDLLIRTEFGEIKIEPCEICVVQRGMCFQVEILNDKPARGYVLEVYAKHFRLPELGPIGSNGLANAQDFFTPIACYDVSFAEPNPFIHFTKFGGQMFESSQEYTPFDVVAYRGNYVPYKYDLRKFLCINSVSYDHPDPSIYTVLTCPSDTDGVATADFVVFPPRWVVMENTFRPPWFHRNTMSEYMGMIWGKYDGKLGGKGGFVPGGASLHQCMAPHGPDAETYSNAANEKLEPRFLDSGLAFMFETKYILRVSRSFREGEHRQRDYQDCWTNIACTFDPEQPVEHDFHLLQWRNKSQT